MRALAQRDLVGVRREECCSRACARLRLRLLRGTSSGMVKRTTVHETVNIEYRIDAYNLFNRQLFGNIDVNLSDPNFGRSTGVMIQPRFLQMALKLNF